MLRLAVIVLSLTLAACAGIDKNYAALLASQEAIATARADAEKARFAAIAEIAKGSADPAARTAAVMALALGGGANAAPIALPPPPESDGYKWAALILGPVTNIASGYFGYRLGVTQSDNAAMATIASYSTFGQMGGAIERAGVAGYPFVQAPGPVTTTTTTNTTTNSNNTTRTCTGGQAGNGAGTTTGGAGGAGGPASC
ncbi:MAG: hypothetical protein IPP91_11390 [Betaproteobacteria bacterium]|nr:hypothetical protein [Betaproteobacteria bacterium]